MCRIGWKGRKILNVYVVSLGNADMRRAHIRKEFAKHDISFEFYDAVTPGEYLDNCIKQYLPNLASANLTGGEKACFMSHFLLWKKCAETDLDYICICEDDILLGENAGGFLNGSEWLDSRFARQLAVVRLETFLHSVQLKKTNIQAFQGRCFPILKSNTYGTAGYILPHNTARYLLEWLPLLPAEQLNAIDEILFSELMKQESVNVYQTDPGLCVQELQYHQENSILNSGLEADRAVRHKELEASLASEGTVKKRKNIFIKIVKEFQRFKRRLNHYRISRNSKTVLFK